MDEMAEYLENVYEFTDTLGTDEISEVSGFEIELSSNEQNIEDIGLLQFIETYESLPELWNPTSPNYINKTTRNAALDKLLNVYKKIKPTANRTDVRRKINTLMTNYRKELKKILSSKRSGCGTDEVYKPTSYVFYALQFLDKFEQPVNENVQQINENSQSTEDSGNRERSPITMPSASSSSILPPPKPQLQRNKSKNSPQMTTRNELLQKACMFLDSANEDEKNIPTICKAWGEKLNNLESKQRILAEKAINDVLFEASMGNLHRDSVKIDSDKRHWTNIFCQQH